MVATLLAEMFNCCAVHLQVSMLSYITQLLKKVDLIQRMSDRAKTIRLLAVVKAAAKATECLHSSPFDGGYWPASCLQWTAVILRCWRCSTCPLPLTGVDHVGDAPTSSWCVVTVSAALCTRGLHHILEVVVRSRSPAVLFGVPQGLVP